MKKKYNASKTLAKNSAKMAMATTVSRVLGLVREQVMAGVFGASGLSDAFFVAYRIPNLLRGLFAEGAFSAAFVPSFIEAKEQKGHKGANALLWRVFMVLAMVTALFSLGLTLWADRIVALFVDELFMADQSKYLLAVKLTQVMSPYLCLTSLAAVFMGALNSYGSYFTPALAPAIFNVVVIVSALVLPRYLEGEYHIYYAISYGIVLGGVAQLLFQLPKLLTLRFKPTTSRSPWLKKYQSRIISKMGPGVLGTAAQHMNLLISTILATGSTVGAVSWLTYAFRLFQFPVGVIGVSIGNSFLVEFSRAIKKQERAKALEVFKKSHELSLLLLIPIGIIGFIGADFLVKLVFERGKFDEVATRQTALALKYYLLSLPLYGYYKNLNGALYALEKAKLPVMISSFSIVLSLGISWFYIDQVGFQILALSNGIVFFSNIVLMALAMKKIAGWGIGAYFTKKTLKILILGLCVAFMSYQVNFLVLGSGFTYLVWELSKLSVFVFTLFFGGLVLLGDKSMIKRIIKRK